MWRISIHRDFDSFGGPLSPCGSYLLRLEPFTQIRSRTLWTRQGIICGSNTVLCLLRNLMEQTLLANFLGIFKFTGNPF